VIADTEHAVHPTFVYTYIVLALLCPLLVLLPNMVISFDYDLLFPLALQY